jgi:hypothetical protein
MCLNICETNYPFGAPLQLPKKYETKGRCSHQRLDGERVEEI